MARLPKVIVPGSGWAWAIKRSLPCDRPRPTAKTGLYVLCNWVEPTKARLFTHGKPPHFAAIPVYVRIIAMRDVRRAKKVRP